MAIKGNLAEFSLPAIFQFLERQQATGLLLINAASGSPTQERLKNYVWLQQGRIVAVAETLDNQGLSSLISQRGWLKVDEIRQIVNRCCCAPQTPMGVCLRQQGALSPEQLKLLFYVSVLLRVCALFKLKEGQFVFDTTAALPREEMTGMSLSATEATLLGLRVLRDWTSLAAKLPAPNSVLCKAISGQPHLRLDSLERQVWQLVDGKASVTAIAEQLHLCIKMVRQIVYRLSMVGLLEEVGMMGTTCGQSDRDEAPVERATTNLDEDENAWVQNPSLAFLHPQVALTQPSDGVRHAQQSNSLKSRSLSQPVVLGSTRKSVKQSLVF